MDRLLLPLLIFAIVGGVATVWLLRVRLRREEEASGIRALSGMHWRELQRLVVAAMQGRGYRPTLTRTPLPTKKSGQEEVSSAPDEDGLVELEAQGQTWLLSTKHGTAYVLGPAAIVGFASAVQLHGAAGGWMATMGTLSDDNIALARLHRIQLLDGRTLWSEIAPLLDDEQRAAILGPVRARAKQQVGMAWGAALVLGVAAFFLSASRTDPAEPVAENAPQASQPAPGTATVAAPPAPIPPPALPTDAKALAERRTNVARALGTLSFVDRALWSTQSTLIVHLSGEAQPDKSALCALIEPYPELVASRLQLQPPAGSEQAVRFMQCRAY